MFSALLALTLALGQTKPPPAPPLPRKPPPAVPPGKAAPARPPAKPPAGKPPAGTAKPNAGDAGVPLDADGGVLDGGALDGGALDGGVAGPKPGGEAGFLFVPDPPNEADATVLPPPDYEGPGASLVKYAAQQQEQRDEKLAKGKAALDLVWAAVLKFFKTSGGDDPRVQRNELKKLAEGPLEESRKAYLAAAEHEKKRLTWVSKIVRDAAEAEEPSPLPNVDLTLVERRLEALREGRVQAAIELRFSGYKGLTMGIVAWVDGETKLALERLKTATRGTPDLALTHLYLGYVYYILEQVNDALACWRKAMALEPDNQVIRNVYKDHEHERN